MNQEKSSIDWSMGFTPIIILIILVIVGMGIGIYLVNKNYCTLRGIPCIQTMPPYAPTPTPELDATISATPDPSLIIGWKTYNNANYGLEMKYPKEFSLKDIGSNQEEINSTRSAEVARTRPLIESRVAFTDSNKNQFTLNFYPISADSNLNTNTKNLHEYSGFCGTQVAERTISNVSNQIGGLSYKMVSQIGPNGKSLTDFCFFNTKGNLIVLRNESGSTEIAMKLILSTVKLTE